MKIWFVIRTIGLTSAILCGIAACAQPQPDLANPVVKGDRSTIVSDIQATDVQQTEPNQ